MTLQTQIHGRQRLQETHAARPVAETVVCFQGEAAAIVVYSDKITIVTF